VYEEKKVVMTKSRPMALLRCMVHLIPISAAIVLLVFNGSNYYVGGELSGASNQDSQKLGALLFAAKLHELFMLASLGAIVVTHVRKQLVFGQGVAFGTVFSGTQFKDLTFLWSPELWGSVYQEWQKKQTKWFTISLLVICSIMGFTVGPSTGNLMRPRLDQWPAGGTTFWINATNDQLSPRIMEATSLDHCAVDNGEQSCPASGWEVFNEQYFAYWKTLGVDAAVPQALYMSGRSSLRQMSVRSRETDKADASLLWANAFTLATISPSVIADALVDIERYWILAAANAGIGRYRFRRDVTFSTEATQPFVLTRCSETKYKSGDQIKLQFPSFRNVTLSKGPGSAAVGYARFSISSTLDDTNVTAQIERLLVAGKYPSLFWIDDVENLRVTESSMTVVATVPPRNNRSQAAYYTCSIDSRFARTTLKSLRSAVTEVIGAPEGYDGSGTFNPAFQRVNLTTAWAAYLNPIVPSLNRTETVFSKLASTAGLWTSTRTTNPAWFPVVVENILALLVVNGLGRANFNTTTIGTLVGVDELSKPWTTRRWVHEILPKSGKLGYGGNAFIISPDEKAKATEFTLKADILGYAYSTKGTTQIAAMTVLSFYVVLVLLHIGYSVTTGWYTSNWGSPSELTALAMNSEPTTKLENTGGGIETIQVFREQVRIRVRDERLQMVFEGDAGVIARPGKAYA
jgi:hypothetical protein